MANKPVDRKLNHKVTKQNTKSATQSNFLMENKHQQVIFLA